MNTLLHLPPEIIELILSFLSGKDYCTSLCVCSSWYNEFIHYLYKNLTIRGEGQLEQVCRNLLHHAPVYLGNSVRTINLRIESISNRHLSQLGAWCPNVESLSLRWSIWHESELQQSPQQPQPRLGDLIDDDDDNEDNDNENDNIGGDIALGSQQDIKRKEKYPVIMASFIGPFMKLNRLTLDVSFGKRKVGLPKFIPFLPRLTSLTLANGTHLSLAYIEYIHKMCPSLQHLSLQGTFIGSIPNMIIPADSTADLESSSSPTAPTTLDIIPAMHLLTVEMEFVIGSYEKYLDWLSYFALKYPNMVSFEFRQHGMIFSPTDPSTLIVPVQYNDDPKYDAVFTRLANGCRQLSDVHLYNIHIHPGFFDKMGPTLDHVSMHLPVFPTMPYLSSLLHQQGLRQHLTSLDLSLPVKNTTSLQSFPDNIISVIGQLDQLKSLTLRWKSEQTCLHLDTLLQHLAHLKQLTLIGLKLGLQERLDDNGSSTETTMQQHTPAEEAPQQPYYPLQSLTLRDVKMIDPHHLFPWINYHINLSHLALAQSCRSLSSLDNEPVPCVIWLPDTKLKTFTVTERRHHRNPIRLYMLHQTATTDQQRQANNPRMFDDYRPRFTDLGTQIDGGAKHGWYFMIYYDHETVSSSRLAALSSDQHFEWVVPYHNVKDMCPWYPEFCDTAYDVLKDQGLGKNMVDDIDGIEYMHIVCRSIRCLKVNDQRLPFA
ncbi:hypothetical protein [Absidia glauca]|uniref:F-box domain-containing protein n=1 Tax=Absidia glauca TaxID=4829 RepID=A0A168QPM7_ABSGL|nr:hypothetical protein [Absidia glauca]